MKGFITRVSWLVSLLGGLSALGGCTHYRDVVDPCYPERYEKMSRAEVNQAFTPQVQNGHYLDQTVLDSHFEPGTAKLNRPGMDHLHYLVRRRPCPDTTIWLQSAELTYDPSNPDTLNTMAQSRLALNNERVEVLKKYLAAESAGRPGISFTVAVHDPATPSMLATQANSAERLRILSAPAGMAPSSTAPQSLGSVQGNTSAFP